MKINNSILGIAFVIATKFLSAQSIDDKSLIKSMTFSGNYYKKNVYVLNFKVDSVYSVKEVLVNGQKMKARTNEDAFEINFKDFKIKKKEPVVIQIKYIGSKSPTLINPEALFRK